MTRPVVRSNEPMITRSISPMFASGALSPPASGSSGGGSGCDGGGGGCGAFGVGVRVGGMGVKVAVGTGVLVLVGVAVKPVNVDAATGCGASPTSINIRPRMLKVR